MTRAEIAGRQARRDRHRPSSRHKSDRLPRPPRDVRPRARGGGVDLGPRAVPGAPARPAGGEPDRHDVLPDGERVDRRTARWQRHARRRRPDQPGRAGDVRRRHGPRGRPARRLPPARRRGRGPRGVRGRVRLRHRRHRTGRHARPRGAASRVRPRRRRRVRRPVDRPELRPGHPRRRPARRGRQSSGRTQPAQSQPADRVHAHEPHGLHVRRRTAANPRATSSATSPGRSPWTTCSRRLGTRSTRTPTWPCSTTASASPARSRAVRAPTCRSAAGRWRSSPTRARRRTCGRRSPSPPAPCWRRSPSPSRCAACDGRNARRHGSPRTWRPSGRRHCAWPISGATSRRCPIATS